MEQDQDNNIVFLAELKKISTTVDGGWNITLAIGQDEAQEIMKLSELRDTLLSVAVVPTDRKL